jgi:hypothetical protein
MIINIEDIKNTGLNFIFSLKIIKNKMVPIVAWVDGKEGEVFWIRGRMFGLGMFVRYLMA